MTGETKALSPTTACIPRSRGCSMMARRRANGAVKKNRLNESPGPDGARVSLLRRRGQSGAATPLLWRLLPSALPIRRDESGGFRCYLVLVAVTRIKYYYAAPILVPLRLKQLPKSEVS
jgi:hypothetical protein